MLPQTDAPSQRDAFWLRLALVRTSALLRLWVISAAWMTAVLAMPVQAQQVSLVGISGERALVVIDQQAPRFLSPGQSHSGVKLLNISGQQARIEVDGKPALLVLGEAQVSVGKAPGPASGGRVVLTADGAGHFMTPGTINGKTVQFMVDTGATSVILGQSEATRIGLKPDNAQKVRISTANGVVEGQTFKLASVRVGDAEVREVTAVVLPQPMPFVLLGNSFLNRFQMRRDSDQMTLEKRY